MSEALPSCCGRLVLLSVDLLRGQPAGLWQESDYGAAARSLGAPGSVGGDITVSSPPGPQQSLWVLLQGCLSVGQAHGQCIYATDDGGVHPVTLHHLSARGLPHKNITHSSDRIRWSLQ